MLEQRTWIEEHFLGAQPIAACGCGDCIPVYGINGRAGDWKKERRLKQGCAGIHMADKMKF